MMIMIKQIIVCASVHLNYLSRNTVHFRTLEGCGGGGVDGSGAGDGLGQNCLPREKKRSMIQHRRNFWDT